MCKSRFLKFAVLLLMLVILTVTVLAGCKPAETNQPPATSTPAPTAAGSTEKPDETGGQTQEPIKVHYIFPGDPKRDDQMVIDAVNEKLKEDGVPIVFSREPLSWDIYFDKLNQKLMSGEEFDMFHIMQDLKPYNVYYAQGALQDVTDYVEKYGPVIKEKIPQDMLTGSSINGRLFVIPTYWVEVAADNYMPYRTDVFKKYNLELPQTPEQILDAFRTVRADWDGVNKPILNFSVATYDPNANHMFKIHRTYDRYPFVVKDSFFQVFQDGHVESWFESPEFKLDADFMNAAYKEGIIQPDILTTSGDVAKNLGIHGDSLMWTCGDLADVINNNPDADLDTVQTYLLAPDKPILRFWGVKNANGVSVTSKHPEGPVMFINWLWSSQENYDLYMYGIEGVHWRKELGNEERGLEWIKDPETNDTTYLSGGDSWIGNIDMVRYSSGAWNYYNKGLFTRNPDAVNSVAGSFFFDTSEVATEYANVQAEAAIVMTPIAMGVEPYDEYFDEAIARLKAAGLDKLVEEYQRQLTEFLEQQK
ncbi:MAG TPA: extracellular solute-binding protein [Clostridiales bacterium]|nr:extracellular solute-binding protein [Clostridiales bacterium]